MNPTPKPFTPMSPEEWAQRHPCGCRQPAHRVTPQISSSHCPACRMPAEYRKKEVK